MILGGHSAGASTAVAYAAWDFAGSPGYRDIDGLVLIDGGLLGSFKSADLARAKAELADIRSGKVFLDILGLGVPEINGIFTEVGALWASKRPDEPSVLQEYPLLPDYLKPPMRVTNEAMFGYAFDESTSPESLSIIHTHAGRLADAGDLGGLAGRRADSDKADDRGVGRGVAERDRVVLPAPPAARHRRREPAEADCRRSLSRPSPEARQADRRAAVRVLHRSDRWSRGSRCPPAGEDVEDRHRAGGDDRSAAISTRCRRRPTGTAS